VVPDPWVFPVDHFKLMFDSSKVGQSIHLTERKKDQFGLALLTPAVTRLVGFGDFAVNMSFDVSFDKETTLRGGRFVIDYGTKRSCFYSKTLPRTPHVLPRPSPNSNYEPLPGSDKVLPPPDFKTKPLPWPCPPGSCPCEDELTVEDGLFTSLSAEDPEPTTQELTVPDCDGISLALITDPIAPGVYVAKDKSLLFAGREDLLQSEVVTVTLEYTRSRESEHMKFLLNGQAVTEKIPFTTAALAQGARIFPKITFVASTASRPVSHRVSSLWFEMEKVISCAAAQEMIEENENMDTRMFEFAMMKLNAKEDPSHQTPLRMTLVASVAVTASVALLGLLAKLRRVQHPSSPYESL